LRLNGSAGRITEGPDGALWFTEPSSHAIGRITTGGRISRYPLTTGLTPNDITANAEGVWFAADGCVGRLGTPGQVTTWPLKGSEVITGITAAPDRGLWVADPLTHTVRLFTPPADDATGARACYPPSVTREDGAIRATLFYEPYGTRDGGFWFRDARVRIYRNGKLVFHEAIPPYPPVTSWSSLEGFTRSFAIVDLDGARVPEITIQLNTGGASCCTLSRVYRFVSAYNTFVPEDHFWGAIGPSFEDLSRNGRVEFVSSDNAFMCAFTGCAGSVSPIQIWSYDHGRFRDVTRRYPRQIRRDAARWWRLYRHDPAADARGLLPAWAADEYALGDGQAVNRALADALKDGYLVDRSAPGSPSAFIHALDPFLRRTGYVES
jgi:hypothetical protein